jgi:ADP-heptose:LPS heptosyltransferase
LIAEKPDLTLLMIEGEADAAPAQFLTEAWKDLPLLRARLLPLPILAALLRETALYLGHDSGITHLAAASRLDLPVIALFGPTDPIVWSPPREKVQVFQASPELSPDISRVFFPDGFSAKANGGTALGVVFALFSL